MDMRNHQDIMNKLDAITVQLDIVVAALSRQSKGLQNLTMVTPDIVSYSRRIHSRRLFHASSGGGGAKTQEHNYMHRRGIRTPRIPTGDLRYHNAKCRSSNNINNMARSKVEKN